MPAFTLSVRTVVVEPRTDRRHHGRTRWPGHGDPIDASALDRQFDAFYRAEHDGQVRRAALLLGSHEAAADVVHDAFVSKGELVYVWDGSKEPEQQTEQERLPVFDWPDPTATTTTSSTSSTVPATTSPADSETTVAATSPPTGPPSSPPSTPPGVAPTAPPSTASGSP